MNIVFNEQPETWWDEDWNHWATRCDRIAFDRHQNVKIINTDIDTLKITISGTNITVTLYDSGH